MLFRSVLDDEPDVVGVGRQARGDRVVVGGLGGREAEGLQLDDGVEVGGRGRADSRADSHAPILRMTPIASHLKPMQKAPDERERLKAAELLGKRMGFFKERVELSTEEPSKKLSDILDQLGGEGLEE